MRRRHSLNRRPTRLELAPLDGLPMPKRLMDVFCLLVSFPAWLLLMAGVGGFILLVSPGPVFFVQERIGHRGRKFKCVKFRTMKPNVSAELHQNHVHDLIRSDAPMTKLDAKGDPRLIPFGAFIRASGLDELPQLLNVFLGQMSLVGPRPCTPCEYELHEPWQKERFHATPGLTGLWQVSGKNATTFLEMIRLDIAYVRRQSVFLDLRIIARTFGVLAAQIRGLWTPRREPARVEPAPLLREASAIRRHRGVRARSALKRAPGKAANKGRRRAVDATAAHVGLDAGRIV